MPSAAGDQDQAPVPVRLDAPGLDRRGRRDSGADFTKWAAKGASNLGLALGRGGLIDVDIDLGREHLGALREIAAVCLPWTAMRSGRPGNPDSHHWYRVTDALPETKRYRTHDKKTIIEVRSSGAQTMVPPSVHDKTDDVYAWVGEPWGGDDGPADASGKVLAAQVALFALIAHLYYVWPGPGSRHDAYLALAGGLLRQGDGVHPLWERNLPILIEGLVAATRDRDGARSRVAECVTSTVDRLRAGRTVQGWPSLTEHLDTTDAPKAVDQLRRLVAECERLAGWSPASVPSNAYPTEPRATEGRQAALDEQLGGGKIEVKTENVDGRYREGGDGLTLDRAVEFWESRPDLSAVRQQARARRVGPWGVLAGVLARVVAATPPELVLPPLVGGYGSLNQFWAVVAASGGGKGASQAAADDLISVYGEHFNTLTVGSGEGISAAYVRLEGNPPMPTQFNRSALFDVPEVDTLTALGGRKGSTLLSELRKVWSGEGLGFQNADRTRRFPVPAHSYRAALVLGVQPGRAAALLDDVDGGLPQRFCWVPVTDAGAPDVAPEAPKRIAWRAPQLPGASAAAPGRRLMGVCASVRHEVDATRLAGLRGDGEALDGHSMLARLKLAAALALLDGRTGVLEEDWRLAGTVMEVSDHTRAQVVKALAEAARKTNEARAEAQARAAQIVAVRRAESDEDGIERCAQSIVKVLGAEPGGLTRSRLRNRLSPSARQHFEAALERLDECVLAEVLSGQGQPGVRYTLSVESDCAA